jgi:hypothetical protein
MAPQGAAASWGAIVLFTPNTILRYGVSRPGPSSGQRK